MVHYEISFSRCRNIFAIQQNLTNITMSREGDLDRARQYYELLYSNPDVSASLPLYSAPTLMNFGERWTPCIVTQNLHQADPSARFIMEFISLRKLYSLKIFCISSFAFQSLIWRSGIFKQTITQADEAEPCLPYTIQTYWFFPTKLIM